MPSATVWSEKPGCLLKLFNDTATYSTFEDEKFWIFYNLVLQALTLVTAWRGVSHIHKHEIMPVEWKELAYVKLLFVKQEVTALERLVKDG